MKKKLITILKFGLPLALGIFLIWLSFRKLTPEDIDSIKFSFKNANYFWIWVSIILAILSHVSRAYRWRYTLEPLGYHPKFLNSFMAVMIGYLVNLGIPRMGEISRAAAMTKYENIPFNKGFGTIIAERVADMIFLMTFIFIVVAIQLSTLQDYLIKTFENFNPIYTAITLSVLALLGLLFLKFIQRSEIPFFIKVREFILGILEGIKAILKMKDSSKFIAHTFLIWFLYVLMFYLGMNAIPELNNVPFGGVLSAFVIGGISIAVTNGGIGAYPYGVMQILILYHVDAVYGLAFGWIIWSAQTIMVLVIGGLSFIFIPIYNKDIDARPD
ncbi:MAG: TIGR00374 family protein [Bacteroidetes bacterium]|nr:MAG: TIGR00374 family protein [Bacteroidota bacterium]